MVIRFPLAILSAVYIFGIIAAEYVSIPLLYLFLTSFSLLALAFTWKKARWFLIPLLTLAIGHTNGQFHTAVISPNDLRIVVSTETREAILRGRMIEAPVYRPYEKNGEVTWRTMARIEAAEAEISHKWRPVVGNVMVNTFGMLPTNYFVGQPVEVRGIIHEPKNPSAPGLFDYRTFLRRQGVYYQLDAASIADWSLQPSASLQPPMTQRFFTWAQQQLHYGLADEDESLRLLWAMTLGWKTGLTDDVSQRFIRSGTMHIFAISGLHIALIAGILVTLLRVARVPRTACGLIVIPLIWFYTAASGWQPSACRSTLMMTVVIVGWALKKPGNLLNSLGAAGLAILLWDPQQLFQASFQLSFFVVLSLALFSPRLEEFRRRILKHDPFLPDELRPRWKRWLDLPVRFITVSLATSLAAWLGSIPLVAHYFHLITPISLLANVVVVPLSSLALMSNLGALICSFAPPIAESFNCCSWFLMTAMVRISDWCANSPGAYFHIREPSLVECFVYYAVVVGGLAGGALLWKRWKWTTLASVTLMLPLTWSWIERGKTWNVTVLPLSGGESVFVDGPGKSNDLLIDCGNDSAVHYVIEPFLHARGLGRMPHLVLTHGDIKNVGGASNVISEFHVNRVYMSPVKFRSPPYRVLRQSLEETPDLKLDVSKGDQIGAWTVLHPEANDKFSQADDGPLILRGTVCGTTFLFLSDLSRAGQRLLWDRHEDLHADVVVTGLARDSEPLNDALLDKISPKTIIVTDSEFPSSERATKQLRERLARRRIEVFYCRDTGAVNFELRPGTIRITTANAPKDPAVESPVPTEEEHLDTTSSEDS